MVELKALLGVLEAYWRQDVAFLSLFTYIEVPNHQDETINRASYWKSERGFYVGRKYFFRNAAQSRR
jgi:hypothetical protein